MIVHLSKKLYVLFFTLALIGLILSSCEKKAGYALVPDATATGGSIFKTATGTVTFTIENVGSYTWTLPNYYMGLGTTPTTGTYAFSTVPSTLVTAGPNNVQQALDYAFSVSYLGITAGTYSMNVAGSLVKLPGLELSGAGGTEVVTVTSENITITSTSFGTVTGSVKGSFDGKMMNINTNALVKVSGTFDVSIK